MQHIRRRHLAPCLRQRNEVRQRRADVRRHHVRAHAGFKCFRNVVVFSVAHRLHFSVNPRLLPGEQIRVFVQLRHEVRKGKPRILHQLHHFVICFVRRQRRVLQDAVDLFPHALVARAVADLCGQRPETLDVARVVDDVRSDLNVPVKALQRVVGRRIAEPLLDVCHVPDARPERLRQAVDRRGQRRHLVRNAEVPSESCQQAPVLVVFLKMWEISLHIIYRLIAVFHPHAVHVLIELIVDASEFLHGVFDLRVVQLRVFLVEFLNCRVPFLVAKSAALLHARMLRQIVPVELRFPDPLHRVALRN